MKKEIKVWLKAALTRSTTSAVLSSLSMMFVGMTIEKYSVVYILLSFLLTFVLSMAVSVFGLPETNTDGQLLIDSSNPNKDVYRLELRDDVINLSQKSVVRFDVITNVDLSQK